MSESSEFKIIRNISDVQPFVEHKKEIRFMRQNNGLMIGCYMFADSNTFDSPEAMECRGITFDENGDVVSRPLHKFFNVGERAWLMPQDLIEQEKTGEATLLEKMDGSMIATAWVKQKGGLLLRSKKSFASDVVFIARKIIDRPENENIAKFMREVSASGMTAIFELTAPEARIVVLYPKPALTLLHVRDNVTGQYVMTDHGHEIHSMIRKYNIPVVRRYEGMSVGGAIQSLEQMNEMEGYVIQFKSGLMAKLKCPWYLRLHRCVTFLRERDIAKLAIAEELDDVKAMLVESGVDLTPVEGVESRVKNILTEYLNEIEKIYSEDRYLERKDFALKHKGNEVFGLLMARYLGKEVPLVEWYSKNKLSQDFSLNVLADGVRSEELDMQTPKEKMRA